MFLTFVLLTILLITSKARPSEKREVHALIMPSPTLKNVPTRSFDMKFENSTPINRMYKRNSSFYQSRIKHNKSGSYEVLNENHDKRVLRNLKEKKEPKIWDHWGKWSTCSVTCGIGKMTRWRHCVSGGCASGEKEAQIRTCTNPAC